MEVQFQQISRHAAISSSLHHPEINWRSERRGIVSTPRICGVGSQEMGERMFVQNRHGRIFAIDYLLWCAIC
jgi:hypothetical protein